MKKKIVLITADEHRHKFFKYSINNIKNIDLLLCIYEDNKKRQSTIISKSFKKNNILNKHFMERRNFEKKYLKVSYKRKIRAQIRISRNELNTNQEIINRIINLKPDMILSYGCSLIKNELINKFKNKFINLHLGLSPYYKGSATNFWPIVNSEFQFLGASFMLIDDGIDSGPLIHQFRPKIYKKDNIHSIGCRIIKESINEFKKILKKDKIVSFTQKKNKGQKLYKRLDLKEQDIKIANESLKKIEYYIKNKQKIDKKFPIIKI